MIDLHCHILPGVDDGSRSVQGSLEMARGLAEQGVEGICATPHTTSWSHAGDTHEIRRRVDDLQRAIDAEGVAIRVFPGAEVHVAPTLPRDAQRNALTTLNGTNYLLLEFPYDALSASHERLIFELQLAGLRVVLAHPERIGPFADDPALLFELISRGCLGQMTAASLAGRFGSRIADVSRLFVEHRLVHVIASDAHDAEAGGRLDALHSAREAAARLIGREAATRMFDDLPAKIIAGAAVCVEPPLPVQVRRFWFRR